MNGILVNVSVIFIWIGSPKPHLRRFRLAADVFVFVQPAFCKKLRFIRYV